MKEQTKKALNHTDADKINMLRGLVESQDYYIRLLSELVGDCTDNESYKLQRAYNKVYSLAQKMEDLQANEIQLERERNL